jgi:hypothetical protein
MGTNWIKGNPNDRSVEGFRIRHGSANGPMSRKFYYTLKKKNLAPREIIVLNKTIITPQDELAWDQARAEPKGAEARMVAKTKAWRRRRSKKSGAAAAASPKHISKQGPRKQRVQP